MNGFDVDGRAELRGKLAATQEQIKALQTSLVEDAHRQHLLDCDVQLVGSDATPVADLRVQKLQVELVQALRDNELLRQIIGNGPAEISTGPSPQLGHRTVSSTQLASASRSSLTVQQRREVADMVRRQENLRNVQADKIRQQLHTLEMERDFANQQLVAAEQRLAESLSEMNRLEEVRLQDNREAANDQRSWENERQILTRRVEELVALVNSDSPNSLFLSDHAVNTSVGTCSMSEQAAQHRFQGDSAESHFAGSAKSLDELRSTLAEMQRETDRQVRSAAEADETAYEWFVRTHHSNSSSRESLAAEVALLNSHICSWDQSFGKQKCKVEAILENVASKLLRLRLVRVVNFWRRAAENGILLRNSFNNVFRGLAEGATQNLMRGLSKLINENTSVNMFKVVTGLMLRVFRRPPFRAPFLYWAYLARRNKMLWNRSSQLIFSVINGKLRSILNYWNCRLVIRNHHVHLILRRKSVIHFRYLWHFFHDWSHQVQSATQIIFFSRRNRQSQRKSGLAKFFSPWQHYTKKHTRLKQGWRSLKVTRLYRTFLRPFKGWHALTMRSIHVFLDDYFPASAAPDIASLDPALDLRRIWPLEFTVQLGQLHMRRCFSLHLHRTHHLCHEKAMHVCVRRNMFAWYRRIHQKSVAQRFRHVHQARWEAHIITTAFGTWSLQHPRRTNLLLMSSGARAVAGHATPYVLSQDRDQHAVSQALPHDDSWELHSTKFVEFLMPMKEVPSLDLMPVHGTKRMYFVWKTVLTQFEGRLQRSHNAKQCRRCFELWLTYQSRKSSMHRKQIQHGLRWLQTPILIILTRWSAWSNDRHCRNHVLTKFLWRRDVTLHMQVIYNWINQCILQVKTRRAKLIVEYRILARVRWLLCATLKHWCCRMHRQNFLFIAKKRITHRMHRYLLQKAFLHFYINISGIDVNSATTLRPWTRSVVNQAATEHFMFGVIDKTSREARGCFILHRSFSFWAQLTKQRVRIIARCYTSMCMWPLECAFGAWSRFALAKHRMVQGLGASLNRRMNGVLGLCYDMIKAWSWFTRVRRHVKKQFVNQMRRIVRYTLRPYLQFWRAYAATRHALVYTAVWHLTRKYKNMMRICMDYWHPYARLGGILARRAASFFNLKEIRRDRMRLDKVWRFWRAYAASKLSLALTAAHFVDISDAKHAATLMSNVLAFWRTHVDQKLRVSCKARQMLLDHARYVAAQSLLKWIGYFKKTLAGTLLAGNHKLRILTGQMSQWRWHLWLIQLKISLTRRYCANLVQRMHSKWIAYTTAQASLARTGMVVMQRSETRALLRAFDGLRHFMVAVEIALQYRSCLKDILVSSCSGHAFRVWLKYMHQRSAQASHQDACRHKHIVDLVGFVFRGWWMRSLRIRRVRLVFRTVNMFNRHHLRICVFRWRRRIRELKIATAEQSKKLVREAHFLCYTVYRMWKLQVNSMQIDIDVRFQAMAEEQLRVALGIWWDWCRLSRAQYICKATAFERRGLKLSKEAFQKWCYFGLQRLRERRRRRLDAYVYAQYCRIKQAGCSAYRLSVHVMSVLKVRTCARRRLDHIFRQTQAKRRRTLIGHSFSLWFQFIRGSKYWSVTSSRLDAKRHCQLCRCTIAVWHSWKQQRYGFRRSSLRAIKRARLQLISLFLNTWWDLSVREVKLTATCRRAIRSWNSNAVHKFWGMWKSLLFYSKNLSRIGGKISLRYRGHLRARYFRFLYVDKCAHRESVNRQCKATDWSDLHISRSILQAWKQHCVRRKYLRLRQVQVAFKNLRYCKQTVLSRWTAAHARINELNKCRRHCASTLLRAGMRRAMGEWVTLVQQRRRLKRMKHHLILSALSKRRVHAFSIWNSLRMKSRRIVVAFSHTNDVACRHLCAWIYGRWMVSVAKCRDMRRAFGRVKHTSNGLRERQIFGSWLGEVKRRIFLRTSSNKIRTRNEQKQSDRVFATVFATLEDCIKQRKFRKLQSYDDIILDCRLCVVNVMRRVFLKRVALKFLQQWARFTRHGPSSMLRITKSVPEWVLVEVQLNFLMQHLPQSGHDLRASVQDECLTSLRHALRLASTDSDALNDALQVLDLNNQKHTAVIKISRVGSLGSPVSLANHMVQVLSQRRAMVLHQGVSYRIDSARICQWFFVKLHRWWLIRGRALMRAWRMHMVEMLRLRREQAVAARKSYAQSTRRIFATWDHFVEREATRRLVVLAALSSTFRKLLWQSLLCWHGFLTVSRLANQRCNKACALGRASIQHTSFKSWHKYCNERRSKDYIARIVVNEWTSSQMRMLNQIFSGWMNFARKLISLQTSVLLMAQRVLIRQSATIVRRALLTWRAHTAGTLRGRWRNFGIGQISRAVHANKLMIMDRFILQSVRFSFMRWAMRSIACRPLERLVASHRLRHRKALLMTAFDVLCDHRTKIFSHRKAIKSYDKRKRTRSTFHLIQHWKLITTYFLQRSLFYSSELRLRKIARVAASWRAAMKHQIRLASIFLNSRRRFCAKMIRVWKALLDRQDRMVASLAHKLQVQQNKIAIRWLERWNYIARHVQRLQILHGNLAARDDYRRRQAVAHSWRGLVQRRRHFDYVLAHLRQRYRRTRLRRHLVALHLAYRHPPVVRRALLLVAGQMHGSRWRRLAAHVMRSWFAQARSSSILVAKATRVMAMAEASARDRCVSWWLERVAETRREREAQQRIAAEQQLEAKILDWREDAAQQQVKFNQGVAQELQASRAEAAQLAVTVLEKNARLDEQAATLALQTAELARLHSEVRTQKDALQLMSADLENHRANLLLRDGWLENLGKEMDKKDAVARKDKDRIKTLQQMMQEYEREFKAAQDVRERRSKMAGTSGQEDARGHGWRQGMLDASRQADDGVARRTQGSARVLEPRLQLSARSARSSEKENAGPPLGI